MEVVRDRIAHGFKVVEVFLLAVAILVGEDHFPGDAIDLDLHAGMEVEVTIVNLCLGQRDVRGPVREDVLRRARGQRGNGCGANFDPACSIAYTYARWISYQKMHIRVDCCGVPAIADVRVNAVFMVGARIVTVADHSPVRSAAVTQTSRANSRLIAIA